MKHIEFGAHHTLCNKDDNAILPRLPRIEVNDVLDPRALEMLLRRYSDYKNDFVHGKTISDFIDDMCPICLDLYRKHDRFFPEQKDLMVREE